ncbi:hypothetical protein BJV74DRAFT_264226 [Russula compacta]|nr:hypothetical protein BJV74DRAFT_264226 [Russula compacta]
MCQHCKGPLPLQTTTSLDDVCGVDPRMAVRDQRPTVLNLAAMRCQRSVSSDASKKMQKHPCIDPARKVHGFLDLGKTLWRVELKNDCQGFAGTKKHCFACCAAAVLESSCHAIELSPRWAVAVMLVSGYPPKGHALVLVSRLHVSQPVLHKCFLVQGNVLSTWHEPLATSVAALQSSHWHVVEPPILALLLRPTSCSFDIFRARLSFSTTCWTRARPTAQHLIWRVIMCV